MVRIAPNKSPMDNLASTLTDVPSGPPSSCGSVGVPSTRFASSAAACTFPRRASRATIFAMARGTGSPSLRLFECGGCPRIFGRKTTPERAQIEESKVSKESRINRDFAEQIYGAGDGNRTHVRSLGSFYTAIVRRPLAIAGGDYTQFQ